MIDAQSYIAAHTLKDGTPVTIRAIGKDDRSDLLTAFETLDPGSVYTRFFTYKRGLTEPELHELTEGDPNRVVALVVTTPIAGVEKLIGGGRYCSDVTLKSAELAFMTDDAYHGRGIAGLVLQHLIRIGRENGVSTFEAYVLSENHAMLAVFRRSGLPMKKRAEGNTVRLKLLLALDQPPSPEMEADPQSRKAK